MRELIERMENLSEGGSGIGNLKKGKKLSSKDLPKLKVGQLLIDDSKQFRSTNVMRITKIKKGPSVGFNAIYVNPDNPKEKRMASDAEFFVQDFVLDNGEHFLVK